MPPTHTDEGLRAAQEIRERHPGTAVLVLSQYVESGYALELLADSAEGVGYLLKDRVSDVKDFTAAVKRVASGGTALDPEVVSRLVGRRRGTGPLDELSPREREVLELMAEGRSNHGIAERLVVTERAVEKHITSIFGKLNLPAATDGPPPRPRRPRVPPELARPTTTGTILRPGRGRPDRLRSNRSASLRRPVPRRCCFASVPGRATTPRQPCGDR